MCANVRPVQTLAVFAMTFGVTALVAAPGVPPSPEPAPPVQAAASPSASPASDLDTPSPEPSVTPLPAPSGFATRAACDNGGFLALQAEHAAGNHEVTVCGNVAQVLPERTTASGRHKYFFITVDPAGDTIEIVTNVEITGEFDVKVGALANVHGRYYRDSIGTQGIDWTHHNDAGAGWPYPGYVQLDGGRLID